MKTNSHIVSTKRLNNELIQRMESAGLSVRQADFIKKTIHIPENLDTLIIQPIIILTSKTAVRAWLEIVNHLNLDVKKYRVYCLAKGTHDLVSQQGLRIAGIAPDSSTLADDVLKASDVGGVTWVCGNLRRHELPDKLKLHGVPVHEIVAYHTEFSAVKVDPGYQGVLFFSPSAVDSFLSLNSIQDSVAFCLGKTTANHAAQSGYQQVFAANEHTPEALVKTIINFYNNVNIHAQK